MAGKTDPSKLNEPGSTADDADGDVSLDPGIQKVLGDAFRHFSQDIVNQPIPDRFIVLLAQLEALEAKNGSGNA